MRWAWSQRVRGMSGVARKAGLSRTSLYKALQPEGNPEFGTIMRVMEALELKTVDHDPAGAVASL